MTSGHVRAGARVTKLYPFGPEDWEATDLRAGAGRLRRASAEKLAADRAYGSAEMLGWLVHERGIEPHIPVFDKSARTDGTFEREDFTYDREGDVYFCPAGKMLTCKGTLVNDGATLMYRASKYDCDGCTLKPRCSPNAPARKSRVQSTKALATWRATSRRRTPT